MESNSSIIKSTLIIIAIVVIVVITALCFKILKKEKKVEYNLTTSNIQAENTLFKDYKTFKKFSDNKKMEDIMTNKVTFKKNSLNETYTEEFFKNKRLALVAVYEDTSKDYIYSIDDLTYNEDKTEATITYTYKVGTFADVLSSTWYNYMFVELENTVEHVNFVRNK